jgi:hypothetical protein
MTTEINRRDFLAQVVACAGGTSVWLSALLIHSPRPTPNLCRISFGGYGGTSGYRHGSIVRRLAKGPKKRLVRDWSMKNNAFILFSGRDAIDIVASAQLEDEYVKIEMSPEPLVTNYHRRKLPLNYHFRIKAGLIRIDLDEFAEKYPGCPQRKWICLLG